MWIQTFNGSADQTGVINLDDVAYLFAVGASSFGGTSGTWGVGAYIPGAALGPVASSSAFVIATDLADEPTALAAIAAILAPQNTNS
jgi:hypothetical protein